MTRRNPQRRDSGTAIQSPGRKPRAKRLITTAPSVTVSLADAIVIKYGNIFFLAPPCGEVPMTTGHGFGLYYHDCRYLNGYELKIADVHPEPLAARASEGARAVFQLTTPDIHPPDGPRIHRETVGIKWERVIDPDHSSMHETIEIQNFGAEALRFPVTLTFRSSFEDVFEIRGLHWDKKGVLRRPKWVNGSLSFLYRGMDRLYRSLAIHCTPRPDETKAATARFDVELQPGESRQIRLCLVLSESDSAPERCAEPPEACWDVSRVAALFRRSSEEWLIHETQIASNNVLLNKIFRRSLLDLHMLRTSIANDRFFAAGVPWFVTLFGRDSLITALETISYAPEIAEETLRLLARYQGRETNEWRDEEPGKILHELRVGELARSREIPHTPYYGTVDATPLFLILLGRHAAWTGTLSLFKELQPHVERALEWIDRYGDPSGIGYLTYRKNSERGLVNQGWKDSGEAIVTANGRPAEPPIALAEVQGYVYRAKRAVADLYERAGIKDRAVQLREQANDLQRRFNYDFWCDDLGCYALALDGDLRPCAAVTSNAGQVLWSGIASADKARRTIDRLMEPDMFNGWGVRTLSNRHPRYNPIGYHLGTVWPHDNALIAAGCRRYDRPEATKRIFVGMLEAAMDLPHFRLPELFAGFDRFEYGAPVRYPVACHPQAWAAGAIPYLINTMLGLVPEAFDNRVRLLAPNLPDFITVMEIKRLRVGQGSIDVRIRRKKDGTLTVETLAVTGPLKVERAG